jgi:L-cystine uptake protein TcyP (sodium:dicarboxylate symporter family)
MTKTCRNVLVLTNIISLLVWGVMVGVFWCKHLPETKQSTEEVKARIEAVSDLEKAQ